VALVVWRNQSALSCFVELPRRGTVTKARADRNPSFVGVALRDIGRLRSVAAVVARHGFGELLARTSLGRGLAQEGGLPERDPLLHRASAPERFTSLLVALGPTYIKLGQVLSMRKDLFQPAWIEALEQLQDNAPPLPLAAIKDQIARGLGSPVEELFADFCEAPLATASIAQVHAATTHGGEKVVVKIRRPGVEQTMRSDLDLLFMIAQLLESSIEEMQIVGLSDVVTEFERATLRELDFGQELDNLLVFREHLDPTRHVVVPKPHPDLSCRSVLTMDFFDGRAIRELQPESPEAKRAVEEIVHVACKQIFIDRFFHGDPHSGNILIGGDGTLCMLDVGLAGHLTVEERDDIVTLIMAAISADSSTIARVLLRMGTPTQRVNIGELKGEIDRISSKYLRVRSLRNYNSAGFAEEFARAASHFRIKLAPEYAVLIKAAATIEGIIRDLHPNVNLVAIAYPYAKQILAKKLDPAQLVHHLIGEASGLGRMLRSMPEQLDQALHDFQTGNIQVRVVAPDLEAIAPMLHQFGGRVVLALFALSMTLVTPALSPQGGASSLPAVASGLLAAVAWLILLVWHVLGRGRPFRVLPLLRLFRR